MDDHPAIVFRSGLAGRRPGLVGGPDVWEVVAVHRSFDDIERTADWLEQTPCAIETALGYYSSLKGANTRIWLCSAPAGNRVTAHDGDPHRIAKASAKDDTARRPAGTIGRRDHYDWLPP